jgi:hypothetical protein
MVAVTYLVKAELMSYQSVWPSERKVECANDVTDEFCTHKNSSTVKKLNGESASIQTATLRGHKI